MGEIYADTKLTDKASNFPAFTFHKDEVDDDPSTNKTKKIPISDAISIFCN